MGSSPRNLLPQCLTKRWIRVNITVEIAESYPAQDNEYIFAR
jgi:hypothetical protein